MGPAVRSPMARSIVLGGVGGDAPVGVGEARRSRTPSIGAGRSWSPPGGARRWPGHGTRSAAGSAPRTSIPSCPLEECAQVVAVTPPGSAPGSGRGRRTPPAWLHRVGLVEWPTGRQSRRTIAVMGTSGVSEGPGDTASPAARLRLSRNAGRRPAIPSTFVFVSDLRHFLDMPEDAPGPARRMAEHLTLVVRAATAGKGGQTWVAALSCRRRPGRRPCRRHLAVFRADVPPSIEWRCNACGVEGVITGWDRSPSDLRPSSPEAVSAPIVNAVVPPEVPATLRSLLLVDTAGERLVFGARHTDDGVVLDIPRAVLVKQLPGTGDPTRSLRRR